MAGYQIIGVRSFFDEKERKQKRYDAFFEQRWRYDDPTEIFRDPLGVLDRNKVPEEERYNLYYTVSYCGDAKREFKRLAQIAFDVDKLDSTRLEEYVAALLPLFPGKPTVVASGNGLHFIVQLENTIEDKAEHESRRSQYKAILRKIDVTLEQHRLPGKGDPAVWDAARILRIPMTLNIKEKDGEKVEKKCTVLQLGDFKKVFFDWDAVSGAPKLDATNAISEAEMRKYRTNDGAVAMEECLFLKHAAEDSASLPELEWYAAASIIGRFKDGRKIFHGISAGHPGYTPSNADEKLDQALSRSGPRTCHNINNLWGKCSACPHFEKVKSPVVIFSKDCIATEATGFYDVIPVEDKAPKLVPNYRDLLKAFVRDYSYFIDAKAERVYTFDKTHWRAMSELELFGYAERMFLPEPKQTYRAEFGHKVRSANQKTERETQTFFRDNTRGKLNLKNGVLDIASTQLEPHSPEHGFTYVLPYDYQPGATAPTFEKFLKDVTCGSSDFAATLLDFLAYLLIPRIDDHCFLWMSGTGRNGKSTFMEVMQSLVGDENTSAVLLDQFENSNDLEMMNNKLLNISEESDNRKIPSKLISTIKALSAGGLLMVNQKYEVAYKMRPTAKLVFASNTRPRLDGAGQALASRMILVPFNMQLENYREDTKSKVDAKLLAAMQKEMSGILNLALERLRLQADMPFFRVHRAAASAEEVRQLFVESDPVESWLEDCTQLAPAAKTPIKNLYDSYRSYMAESHPKEYLQAIRQFSSTLRAKLHGKIERVEIGHAKAAGYSGIELKLGAGSDF